MGTSKTSQPTQVESTPTPSPESTEGFGDVSTPTTEFISNFGQANVGQRLANTSSPLFQLGNIFGGIPRFNQNNTNVQGPFSSGQDPFGDLGSQNQPIQRGFGRPPVSAGPGGQGFVNK